jgi:hypothetical protein
MRIGTLAEIRELAGEAVYSIEYITGHWTAGRYVPNDVDTKDYHILCLYDGTYWIKDEFTEKLAHTWRRNTNNLGIAFAGCFNATTNDLGQYAPTYLQIQAMVDAVRTICEAIGKDASIFKTHAEWADEDDYGPATTCERWDLWFLRDGDEKGSGGDEIRRLVRGTQA